MMTRLFSAFALALVPFSSALAQVPDLKTVTTIAEAVRQCGIDRTGKRWEDVSNKALRIFMTPEDIGPGGVLEGPLKGCFFPWAYGREVVVEIVLPGAETK